MSNVARDQFNVVTPLTCPICDGEMVETMIRTLGTITANTSWQMHVGRCEEHGWFQAEIVGRPPLDIFAVTKPFGASRRLIVDGREVYQFRTVFNDVAFDVRVNKEQPVDALDAQYWKARSVEVE